jgi:8-oxo-dGTP diphosphatase
MTMKEFGEKVEGVQYSRRPGCYGVVIKGGAVGVIKPDDYDTYFLPGGGIDEGENERETLRREALEEIGREIEIFEKLGEAEEYVFSKAEKKYIVKECHFYRFSLRNESKTESKYELLWIRGNELEKMHFESYRWIAEKELAVFARTLNPDK